MACVEMNIVKRTAYANETTIWREAQGSDGGLSVHTSDTLVMLELRSLTEEEYHCEVDGAVCRM